jgi:ribonuclease HI
MRDGERRQLALATRRAGQPAAPPRSGDSARVLCDGGSRGNPGPSAIAAVLLEPGGEVVDRRATRIGDGTAAVAEYRAILLGLELAATHGADPLEVCSDSRLAIAAVRGRMPADSTLAALAREIAVAERAFSAVRWTWHPRSDNDAADVLVRELLWGPSGSHGTGRAATSLGRQDDPERYVEQHLRTGQQARGDEEDADERG